MTYMTFTSGFLGCLFSFKGRVCIGTELVLDFVDVPVVVSVGELGVLGSGVLHVDHGSLQGVDGRLFVHVVEEVVQVVFVLVESLNENRSLDH